jgi:cupredoxin-like protein
MRGHRILGASLAAILAAASSEVVAQEKVIQVTAEKFKFTPAAIELKLGEPVVLELTTLDRKHGFQIPDLNIDEKIEPGNVTRVHIVPAKAATLRRPVPPLRHARQQLQPAPVAREWIHRVTTRSRPRSTRHVGLPHPLLVVSGVGGHGR